MFLRDSLGSRSVEAHTALLLLCGVGDPHRYTDVASSHLLARSQPDALAPPCKNGAARARSATQAPRDLRRGWAKWAGTWPVPFLRLFAHLDFLVGEAGRRGEGRADSGTGVRACGVESAALRRYCLACSPSYWKDWLFTGWEMKIPLSPKSHRGRKGGGWLVKYAVSVGHVVVARRMTCDGSDTEHTYPPTYPVA